MIAVETIIRKLVSDLEFVIIPGFGALLSHQVPAVFHKDSGVYTPPVKKLAFNEFLKLDDGLLANFISREENITHLEAVGHIKSYVNELRSGLQSKGQTQIEGIGNFRTNGEGKLVFEPNTVNCFKDEWYGFTKIHASVSEIDFNRAFTGDMSSKQSKMYGTDDSGKIRMDLVRWGTAAVLAGLMFFVSFFVVNSNQESNRSTLNPFESFFPDKSDTAVFSVKEKVMPKTEYAKKRKDIKSTLVQARASSSPEKLPEFNTVNKITENVPSDNKSTFYVIAGTFNGMKQAKVLLSEMQAKGYKDAVIIPTSRHSKKVKVAVEGFSHQKDAYQASLKLASVIGENGWVLKNI